MNHKNLLQEFCQKNKLLLPEYDTVSKRSLGLERSDKRFISEVKIIYNDTEYMALGSYETTKKDAEKSAAASMMIKIGEIRREQIKHYSSDHEIYVLIDLENVHVGDYFELRNFEKNYHFIGFATEDHATLRLVPSWLLIETIKSDRRDAADTLMIGYAAVLVNKIYNKGLMTISEYYSNVSKTKYTRYRAS